MDEAEKMWKKDMSTAALKKEEGVALFKRGKIVEALAAFEE